MKMHLLNILNAMDATAKEKTLAVDYFSKHKVSHNSVKKFLAGLRHTETVSKF